MNLWAFNLVALGMAVAVMALTALLSHRRRDLGLVDVGWALSVGLIVLVATVVHPEADLARRGVVAALVLLWAGRLVGHLLAHRIVGRHEDARYQALRERWGDRASIYSLLLHLGEAPIAVLFTLPPLIALLNPAPLSGAWSLLGVMVGVLAIAGEAQADRQLERFRAEPTHRGRTCRDGWWRLSRHPNYFFEWLHWWAYVLLAVGSPMAAWALLGPALMLVFLFKITGIPHTERQALASRGEDYRRYQASTSIFIPWFPRKERAS